MKKLYRSTRDRKLLGICGGLSEMTGWDSTLLRILLIVGAFVSFGTILFLYVIAGVVIPKSPEPPYGPVGMAGGGQWNAYPAYGASTDRGYEAPNAAPGRVDRVMADMETRALRKELDELRNRISNYEKGDK